MTRTISLLALLSALTFSAVIATAQSSQPVSKKQLNAMIADAKTPADHQRIADYYRKQSETYLAESSEHTRMAEEFAKNSATSNSKNFASTVNHCRFLADDYKKKSIKASQQAREHEQMAVAAKGAAGLGK